jgi:hypothetical protein
VTIDQPPQPRRRTVIRATCTVHGGTPKYTNLVVRVLDGHIEFDPHADKSCTIVLDEDAANEPMVFLGAWIG